MEPLLKAVALKNYLAVADRCGLNGLDLLRKNQITPSMIADPDQMLPYAKVLHLLEDSAARSGQESFGLLMAEARTLADYGEVGLMMSHQATLRDALAVAIEYGNLINRHFALSVENRGKLTFLHEETLAASDLPKRQAVELSTALVYQTCASFLGPHWRPRQVTFTHSRPSNTAVHERLFRSKVEFDANFNGILCDTADIDAANPRADPNLAAIARRFMATAPVAGQDELLFNLRKAMYLLLPLGRAKVKQIAPGLGLSVRTLQRQLDEKGLTYSNIINDVRRDLVLGHLGNKRNSVERIGSMLGYTKATSFARWFSAEYGMSPQTWRKKNGH